MAYTVTDALRLAPGPVSLADHDPGDTSLFEGGKRKARKALRDAGAELADLQERMYADAYTGGRRRVLIVLQGMDTSGKGGVIDHALGLLSPNGFRLHSFKKPTEEELEHDFLWRIRARLLQPGMIGVFDRSHYEDVLIVRVHDLVPEGTWQQRYQLINGFEGALAQAGTTVVKVMLHISPDEQLSRLSERLTRPDKYWKYNPGDLVEHASWDRYQEAYQAALTRCSTVHAPWFVVPANRKWYARWAVQQLLVDALTDIDPQWPAPEFDLEVERKRLAALTG